MTFNGTVTLQSVRCHPPNDKWAISLYFMRRSTAQFKDRRFIIEEFFRFPLEYDRSELFGLFWSLSNLFELLSSYFSLLCSLFSIAWAMKICLVFVITLFFSFFLVEIDCLYQGWQDFYSSGRTIHNCGCTVAIFGFYLSLES